VFWSVFEASAENVAPGSGEPVGILFGVVDHLTNDDSIGELLIVVDQHYGGG